MADLETVLPEGGQEDRAPVVPAKAEPKAKDPGKDELAEARREIAELRKTNQQVTESERYWATLAQGKGQGGDDDDPDPEPKAAAIADDDDDPAKLVDELTASGTKALSKRGFLKAADVEKLVAKQATEIAEKIVGQAGKRITLDAQLVAEFPELKNEDSALFKATGEEYRAILKLDPSLKKSPATLFLAAKAAKARVAPVEAKAAADKREEERLERIRAQAGERGGGGGFDDDDYGDALSPMQKQIASQLGVDEKDVLAEKKKMRAR